MKKTVQSKLLPLLALCASVTMLSACSPHSGVKHSEMKAKKMEAHKMMHAKKHAKVTEVATFKLKEGVTEEEFRALNKGIETDYVVKQPGFVARESAADENGEWVVIVHWETPEDADASMKSFMKASGTADFMSKIDTSTMKMKRYMK